MKSEIGKELDIPGVMLQLYCNGENLDQYHFLLDSDVGRYQSLMVCIGPWAPVP